MEKETEKNKPSWWVSPFLTFLIVAIGFSATYGMGVEKWNSLTKQLSEVKHRGSDPLQDLNTRVTVLERGLQMWMNQNSEDHKEIKAMLKEMRNAVVANP